MRMPEPRSSRQLNQLATQLQGEAEISGVNASGTQISSRAFEMVTDFEPAGDQPDPHRGLTHRRASAAVSTVRMSIRRNYEDMVS